MNDVVEIVDKEGKGLIPHTDEHLDLFFKMHQKINAKSEEISKSYKNNILVTLSDIKELHFKTMQSINALNPLKSNVNLRVTVSHNEGESERFNSFEEFERRNITSPNPTSEVLLTYLFSVFDKESEEFENYRVIAHLRSRIAEISQIEKEAPPFISSAIISNIMTNTAKITVHYSDYVKARVFVAMFDEWVRGCNESRNISLIKKMKKYSHLIPRVGKIFIYAILGVFTVNAIGSESINSLEVLKFLVAYSSIFVIISMISDFLFGKIELAIDSYLALSYLNVGKGDSKIIANYESKNRGSVISSIFGMLGVVILGIFSSATYDFIKWAIN